MHSFLEHAHGPEPAVGGHGLAGVQPSLVQALQRARLHPRLLAESNPHLEVSHDDAARQVDRPQLPGALLGREPRRRGDRDRRGRRDVALLECLLQIATHQRVKKRA